MNGIMSGAKEEFYRQKNTMLAQFMTIFMAFFAIMNPLSNLPVFISLVQGDDTKTRNSVAARSLLFAFSIVVVFSLSGKLIFEEFGIGLPALRIVGGILVFLIGYHMLQGNHSSFAHPSQSDQEASKEQLLSVAISPLGMPLLAGPGTIATAMNYSAQGNLSDIPITLAAFGLLCVVTYLCFRYGSGIVKFLGQNGLNIMTRLMGLLLGVIGMQMLIAGMLGAFPGLAH